MIQYKLYPKSTLGKKEILPDEALINQIFHVSHYANLPLFPLTIPMEESYKLWRQGYEDRIQSGTKYLLLFDHDILKGFIAYKLRFDREDISVEDLIIDPTYQCDGKTLIQLLFAFLDVIDESTLNIIQGHTNIVNKKMQKLLHIAGFTIVEYTARGIRYKANKSELRDRFLQAEQYLRKKGFISIIELCYL